MNAGVEVCGDGLQSHLVEGKLYQGVYRRVEEVRGALTIDLLRYNIITHVLSIILTLY